MMKKVLFISFEYPSGKSYCGGVGQIVKQCRNALLSLGYEPYVLITAGFTRRQPVKLLLPDDTIQNYHSLNNFLKEYDWCKFGYIIHHFVNWTKELKAIKNRKGRRPQIIYHFHSILRREKESGFRTLNNFLYNQERMIQIADKIICPSAYEYENFARYFPVFLEKVVLIENTIERFPLKKEILEQIKSEHNIGKDDVVSLYVGRLEKIKGAHIVLDRVPQILTRNKNLKLFFVGRWLEPDLYRQLLRVGRQFPQQFFYKRFLNKKELFQYYYLSDIYINSSLSESFSLSTHESALCNTALLLNRLPVLEKFNDAALFFDINKDDFIRKFEILIKDCRLRGRLAKKAFAVVAKFMKKSRLKQNFLMFLTNGKSN
ncbi:MAG: glycosyltransferase family 4 protein [Candidatus Omnitrophota bacterium]